MAYINGKEIWCAIGYDHSAAKIIDGTADVLTHTTFNGVTNIRKYAFYNHAMLSSVYMPNSVLEIGEGAFQECAALKNVVLPQGITRIPTYAFLGCKALESVDIPSNVEGISLRAFQGCTALKTVTLRSTTPPSLQSMAFTGVTLLSIVVPRGSANAYKAATNWSDYADIITEG